MSERLPLSALVLMRPASGREIGGTERITSENVTDYEPNPQALKEARGFFEKAGFQVTAGAGPCFSIVGSQSLFEEVFGTRLAIETKQGAVHGAATVDGGLELPLKELFLGIPGVY